MISTVLAVLAVGIADFVAGGLRGNPDGGRRVAWGLLSAAVVLLPLIWSKSSLESCAQFWRPPAPRLSDPKRGYVAGE